MKSVRPCLISSDQTAYVKGRFISEGGRLKSDVLEMCDKLQIKGFLMTVDIEKAFDSINHCFLIKVLEKYGFEKDFIKWIKILLQVQEWHRGVVVITTTQLHSTKPEPRFCAGSNPARGGLEIRDGEDLKQRSRL